MKNKSIIIVIFAIIALLIFTAQKEQVGADQVAVRTGLGNTKVFREGEAFFSLPFVNHSLRMTTKPVLFVLAGTGAITATGANEKSATIECKVRYQITDPVELVEKLGMSDPQGKLEASIRGKIAASVQSYAENNDYKFDSPPARMLLTAELLHSLNDETLTPGVQVLSFELVNW